MAKTALNKHESDQRWYHKGLRFQCTGCGNCCTGEPGYVWVNAAEIAAIAEYLGTTIEKLESTSVRRVGIRKSLVELNDGDCIFLDAKTRKCTVYPVRPRQCRTWPFWQSNLKNQQAWEETCEVCPGSGKGKLYSLDEIEEQANVIRV